MKWQAVEGFDIFSKLALAIVQYGHGDAADCRLLRYCFDAKKAMMKELIDPLGVFEWPKTSFKGVNWFSNACFRYKDFCFRHYSTRVYEEFFNRLTRDGIKAWTIWLPEMLIGLEWGKYTALIILALIYFDVLPDQGTVRTYRWSSNVWAGIGADEELCKSISKMQSSLTGIVYMVPFNCSAGGVELSTEENIMIYMGTHTNLDIYWKICGLDIIIMEDWMLWSNELVNTILCWGPAKQLRSIYWWMDNRCLYDFWLNELSKDESIKNIPNRYGPLRTFFRARKKVVYNLRDSRSSKTLL